jgi:hypothetical protein
MTSDDTVYDVYPSQTATHTWRNDLLTHHLEIIKCPSQNDCYLPGLIITRVGVVTVLLILQLLISTSQEGHNCIMFIKISFFIPFMMSTQVKQQHIPGETIYLLII